MANDTTKPYTRPQESALDAVATYARAGESRDVDLLLTAYAPDAIVHSPIVGRLAFTGHDDLRKLMSEVYSVTSDTRFGARAQEGGSAMLCGSSRAWGVRIDEAFVFELDEEGRIASNTVHIRPLVGLLVFTLALGIRMVRHPGVMWRALKRG